MNTQQIFIYRIAAKFSIKFPINWVNIEIIPDLIFRRKCSKKINRFIRLTDPFMFQEKSILTNSLKFLISRNCILLGLYFPRFYIKKMSKSSFSIVWKFFLDSISFTLPFLLLNFEVYRLVVVVWVLYPCISYILAKFVQGDWVTARCWQIVYCYFIAFGFSTFFLWGCISFSILGPYCNNNHIIDSKIDRYHINNIGLIPLQGVQILLP